MTTEELERLVKGGDAEKLAEAMQTLSEADRKPLAKKAAELYKAARQHERSYWAQLISGNTSFTVTAKDMDRMFEPQAMAGLAVLGLCGWTEAKKVGPDRRGFLPQRNVERVLRDRKPDWADKWVEKELESDRGCDWGAIRGMVKDGTCARPTSDRYVTWMIRSGAGQRTQEDTLAKRFDTDPGLLEDEVWRIFEADFRDEIVLTPGDFEHEQWYRHRWGPVLVSLVDSGRLDRSRMVTASLDALNRRQHPQNAAWFCKLHEALKPTLDEKIERQGKYADLLVNGVPAVVGFAVEVLKGIAQARRLETGKVVDGLGAALGLRQKGHALNAARLLKICAKQGSDRARIAGAAAVGLEHPTVEVQEACLEVLEEMGVNGIEEEVAARAGGVAASLQERVRKLLGKVQLQGEAAPAIEGQTELVADAQALPAPWRKLAGVDPLLALLRGEGDLLAVACDPVAVPRLEADKRLTPIGSLDELIEGLSAAVEPDGGSQAGQMTEAEELERMLDGLSRFADQRPGDFQARTAPLLKRVRDLLGDQARAFLPTAVHRRFQFLVRAWVQHELVPEINTGQKITVADFFAARAAKLSQRLKAGVPGPLLACPTHKGGWIEPRALVDRLRYWQSDGRSVDGLDLIQALLRLAPDGRAHALQDAQDLSGEEGAALRFALGGEVAISSGPGILATAVSFALGAKSPIGKRRGLWIAAARARDPFGEIGAIKEAFGEVGADGAVAARYTWRYRNPQGHYYSTRAHELDIEAWQSSSPEETSVNLPTVLLHRRASTFWAMGSILESRWLAQVWPLNPEASFAIGAHEINERLDSPASSLSPTAQYLEPLLDQDVPLRPMARLALGLALLSKDAGTRGMAIDALMTLITDGRCTGQEMAETFVELGRQKDVVRLNRLAAALQEVSRAGPLHAHVAARMMQEMLARLPEVPEDLHHILTPLRELLTGLGETLRPQARVLLEKVKSGGKTGTLVKGLLGMTAGASTSQAAVLEALRGRVERVRKWMERGENARSPVTAGA